MKGKLIRFSTIYSTVVIKVYCGFKIVIKLLLSLVFCHCLILGRHILNIFRTVFPKLLFQQRLKNELDDVLFWESYTRQCIK